MQRKHNTIRKRTLGNYLKKCRVASKMSQKEVGTALGYSSPQFISNWERGISQPPMHALPMLTKIYRLSHKELIAVYALYKKAEWEWEQQQLEKLLRKRA